jgi:hypothetical protein
MNVRLMVIEWNAQGEQVRKVFYSVRAHKEPAIPENFKQVRDDVWQEQRKGKASLALSTWMVSH